MTPSPGRLKLFRGRDSRSAGAGKNQKPQPHDLSAIRLPSTILTDTTVALINRSEGLSAFRPGSPPAENIQPQPQLAVQGTEGGGSADTQFPGRRSETLWEKAVEGLREEERAAWYSYNASQSQAGGWSIDEQIKLVREARDNLTNKQMTIQRSDGRVIIVREKVNAVLKAMNKYMAIGNIAIQHSPSITALVWAGVSLGLQLALSEMKTFEELTAALEDIGNIVSCCRIYEELYLSRTCDSAKAVVNALPLLYTAVLKFIIEVRGYFGTRGLKRSLKALVPFEEQFQPLMDAMKQRKEEVDKRARVAHEVFVQKNMIDSDEDTKKVSNLVDQLGSFGADISSLRGNVGNMLLHLEADKRQKILEWLSRVKYEDHHMEVVKTRLEGTGAWLLQRQEIRNWLESEGSSVLWLHGKAGSGKTVLSSRMIDALTATHGPSSHVLFFYCNYKEQPRREASGILRSLLKQVSGATAAIDSELVSVYDRAQSKGFSATSIDASSTESLFRRALPTSKATYVVIDALDECEVAERKELVTALKSHVSLKHYVIKVFVTSRDEKDLARMLSGTSDFRINADDTALDIRPFVEIKVEECINNDEILGGKRNVTPELRQDLVDTLVSKADGMFLWVKYQLEHICIQGSEHDLRSQLGKLPRGLDQTYSQILEKIDELGSTQKDWAYKTLKWITCAARPLKPKELLQATALEPWGNAFESSKMSNIVYLIETCCHLVTLDARQGVVRFVHYSVQEFLQSRSEFSGAQELVAGICITSLALWQELGVDENLFSPAGNGIYNYAAQNWQLHVQQLSANSVRKALPFIRNIFSDARHFRVWHTKYQQEHNWVGVPSSDAPAYFAVCSFLGITAAAELFLQDETTGLHVKQHALRAAAAAGSQELVQLFLENRVDINAQDGEDGNALQAAAYYGQEEVVRFLLENGVDINAQGGEYGNALQAAAYRGKKAVVRLLLENRADIGAEGGIYGNALQAAACYGEEELVLLLLENGADINAEGGEFGNALQAAAFFSGGWLVRLLLENRADINAEGGRFGNALQAAAYRGKEGVVRLLLEKGADINAQGGEWDSALQGAARGGWKEVFLLLLENGADINAQGDENGSALQAVARDGDEESVRWLLENGADINAQGGEYGNALQAAACYGNESIARLLLKNGAEINAQGGRYGSALRAAAYYGHEAVVRLLLENGADINAQGGEYGSALQAAGRGGRKAMARLLLENGADNDGTGL